MSRGFLSSLGSPDWLIWLCCHSACGPRSQLTYGVAGRGERRDGSVGGRVEWLLDFGADNPGKVNNRHGSINTASRAWRFHSRPAPGHLNTPHQVHLRLCMYKCSAVWAACILTFGAPVTNSQSRGFRGNLSAPVWGWIGAAPWDCGFNLAGFWG